VISGHQDFNSLYAANDTEQQSFTINTLGAPNNSTTVVFLIFSHFYYLLGILA
jgi:hypothetical protein